MGPSYTWLFMGYVEHYSIQSYSGFHPQLFLRHIDDIIGAASLSRLELEKIIDFASNFHPALTFTSSISDSSLPFLNISVSISGDRLATNIHCKPTNSHSYLDYTSSHPASCKDSFPFSQFHCLHRICSDDANIDKGASETSTFFLNRGFPSTILNTTLNRIRPISCTSALTLSLPSRNSNRIPLVLTYHPTKGSSYATSTTSNEMPPPDTYSPFLLCQPSAGIPGPKHSAFYLKFPCELLYIGKMEHRLGGRFTEHLCSVHKKDPELPVACHLNTLPCFLANISVSGLVQFSSEARRKLEEQHLIFHLETFRGRVPEPE
eukprot:g25515.t1